MSLAAGVRLGSYEILAAIGAGGMGEVYRARDTALHRDVAVKVLPEAFARDPERVARFEREARLLAALNHPNIAHVYGIESGALVMELVDGEDLAARVARGPLPVDEAVGVARQIADALEAAHEQGIVHRDLKPANVRLRPDGVVKVLDFGLARETGPLAAAALENSPTITSPFALSAAGVMLGTAAYMAPEQAKGRTVDKRADVWAFGCVCFEMLSGRRPFEGDDVTDVVAAIVKDEPVWARLPPATPPFLRDLLGRCLEKDVRLRLRDIGEARIALSGTHGVPGEPASARAAWRPVAFTAILAAAIGASAVVLLRPPAPSWAGETVEFHVPMGNDTESGPAVSADGRRLAWVAAGAGGPLRVWTRVLGDAASHEVPGTDAAAEPFLSPDGQDIGFFAGGALKRVDVESGTVRTLTPAPGLALGGTWNDSGDILFSSRFGIQRVAASGGAATLVAPLDRSRHENSLRFPQFLPGGRRFLYVARSGRPDENSAYVGSLDGPPQRLFPTRSKVFYSAPGSLLFLRDATLFAQRFDVAARQVQGDAVIIARGVAESSISVGGGFAASFNGVLVYVPAGPSPLVSLHWRDRAGRDLGTLDEPRVIHQFRIAPDDRRVVAAIADEARGTRSLWMLERDRVPSRLTFADTHDWEPVWSPDGSRIAFGSYRDGPQNVYVKDAAGAGADAPLLVSDLQKDPSDWSPDGRFIVFRELSSAGKGDIVAAEVPGGRTRIDVTRSPSDERSARVSGDGRWIAYVSDETGRHEIFVQPFPPTGAKWQVSVSGGDEPAWRHDGRELYFVDARGAVSAVPIEASPAFTWGNPRTLFPLGDVTAFGMHYDVTSDGQRFLVAVPVPAQPRDPATVVVNWTRRLARVR